MGRTSKEDLDEVARQRMMMLAAQLRIGEVQARDEGPQQFVAGDLEIDATPEPADDFEPISRPQAGAALGTSVAASDSADSSTILPAGRHSMPKGPGLARDLAQRATRVVPETLRGRVNIDAGPGMIIGLIAIVALATTWMVANAGGEDLHPVSTPVANNASDEPATGDAVSSQMDAAGESAEESVPSLADADLAGQVDSAASPGDGAEVTVHVAGRVKKPGVFTLPGGSRVIDALEAAGGVRPKTKLRGLNQARVLVDGEQIYVGAPPGGSAGAALTNPAEQSTTAALVSLNRASATELETVPGIGPVTAQKIIDWRDENQAFTSIDELLEIAGVGEKTLAEIAPHVTL